jgi:hypothetical protein
LSAYFIALAIATFFTRAGLMLSGGDRSRTGLPALDLVIALLWAAFGTWGLAVLLGWPK